MPLTVMRYRHACSIFLGVAGMGLSGVFILFGLVGILLSDIDDYRHDGTWSDLVVQILPYGVVGFGCVVGVSGVLVLRRAFEGSRRRRGQGS